MEGKQMKIISFLQTHLSACAKEKHKGILFNELTRILMSNSYNLTESDRDKIVHFKTNQPSSIFKKTALNWANENEDRVLASELLKLEHEIHRTEVAGLKCLRDNLSNDALMAWIIEFYRELANDQSECKRQAVAFLFVFLVLGLLSYLPFSWDLYSDISADISYWRLANGMDMFNIKGLVASCASSTGGHLNAEHIQRAEYPGNFSTECFTGPEDESHMFAIAFWWTLAFIVIPLFFYFYCVFLDPSPSFLSSNTLGWPKWVCSCLWVLCKLFWPVVHFARRWRYQASVKRSDHKVCMYVGMSIAK